MPLDKGNHLEECPVRLSDWTCLWRISEVGRPNRKVRFHLAAFSFSATMGNECLTIFKQFLECITLRKMGEGRGDWCLNLWTEENPFVDKDQKDR